MRHPFRRKNVRLRLLPLYAGALLLLVLARPTPPGLAIGAVLVAAGLALRAWGAGHLVKTERLVRSGPYAYLRHPLYAGALLAGLGFGAMAGGVACGLVAGVGMPFFLFYYLPYKDRIESARLERRYGAAYARYREEVPALIPSRARSRAAAGEGAAAGRAWSLERFRANHEMGTLVAALAGLMLIALGPWLRG